MKVKFAWWELLNKKYRFQMLLLSFEKHIAFKCDILWLEVNYYAVPKIFVNIN